MRSTLLEKCFEHEMIGGKLCIKQMSPDGVNLFWGFFEGVYRGYREYTVGPFRFCVVQVIRDVEYGNPCIHDVTFMYCMCSPLHPEVVSCTVGPIDAHHAHMSGAYLTRDLYEF